MRRISTMLLVLIALASACGDDGEAPTELIVMTHDSFAVSDGLLDQFTARTGVEVRILPAGDAGQMVSQAILTKDNPLADVMYGIDNANLARALDQGIFESYESELLATVPESLQLDGRHRVTPIDFGDVCLNFDKERFAGRTVPQSLRDLTDARYRDELVVENPATSSPGLAFLLATIAAFGEEGEYTWRDYWADLRTNGVEVTSGWNEAYYGFFSAASDGDRPLVVSYASSPPAAVHFADEPLDEAPTGVILDGCFRQIEFAGILDGTKAKGVAGEFIDFMLSREFQEDIPLHMFVFPANSEAFLPPVFIKHTTIPADPLLVDAEDIEANRQRWIEEWTDIVLR